MSNQAEMEYERQFQEDLAKATALSLEQQALDDYRRAKKYGTSSSTVGSAGEHFYERTNSSTSSDAASSYYAQLRSQQYLRGASTQSTPSSTLSVPSTQPQRRYSEVGASAVTAAVTSYNTMHAESRSKTPPLAPQNDLISFASPTAKQAENSPFEKLIEDLQKLSATNPQTALMPLGPTAATPIYRSAPHTAMYAGTPPQYSTQPSGGGGMQLVPFTPPPQHQKVPLTGEELQKLYNMSHQQQQMTAYPHAMGFRPPSHLTSIYAPQYAHSVSAPPTAAASAAYVPPQYPPAGAHIGFQYPMPSVGGATNVVYYPQTSVAASNSSIHSNSSPAAASGSATGIVATDTNSALALHLSKSHSASAVPQQSTNGSSSASSIASKQAILRRQTPPVRRQRTGDDLIDLSQEDESRVSVLEAFDPLLLNEDDGVWKK